MTWPTQRDRVAPDTRPSAAPPRSWRHAARFLLWRLLSQVERAELRWPGLSGRQVSRRRLALSLAALVGLALAAHAWHRRQVARNALELLDTARRAQAQGDTCHAAALFDRYLQLLPDDLEVRLDRARAYDRASSSLADRRRSLELYQASLAAGHELPDVQTRLAEIHYELGEDEAAIAQADAALERDAEHAGAWRAKALAETRRLARLQDGRVASPVAALRALEQAARLAPDDLALIATYAGLLRSRGVLELGPVMATKADALMEELVARRAQDPQAWLARYAYRVKFSLPGDADDLQQAQQRAGHDVEVLLTAARRALRDREPELAERLCQQAVQSAPESGRAYLGLSRARQARGDLEGAIVAAREGWTRQHADPWLGLQLVECLLAAGRHDEAVPIQSRVERLTADRAASLPPAQVAGLQTATTLLRAQQQALRGDLDEAIANLRPLARSGESLAAGEASEQAAIAQRVHALLAQCHAAKHDWTSAGQQFDALAALDPGNPRPLLLAARAWEQVEPDKALRRYERAWQLDPTLEEARAGIERLKSSPYANKSLTIRP